MAQDVNEATFALMSEGRVTSATLMANGPAVDDALRAIAKFPQCSFGAHLNVIEFEPLSSRAKPILTQGGRMSRELVTASASRPRFMQAVYDEFCAQISKLQRAGMPVSHLDSHQHVHTFPWLFPVLKAVQIRFGIRRVRRSRNIYSSALPISETLKRKKAMFDWALRSIYLTTITGGFTDLETFLEIGPADLEKFGCIEIMVHPGAGALEKEVRLLRGDCLKSTNLTARLISYNQLRAGS